MAEVPTASPQVAAYKLPLADLATLAQQSGLNWVNSDPAKIAAAQAAITAEAQPVRVPRERPATVKLDAQPLILVETKLDLKNVTLPFEKTPQV